MTSASDIMKNPAAAAGAETETPAPANSVITDPGVQKLLDNLPGLVGAIDHAIKDTAGKPHAFMLLVFTPGAALHACNTDPNAAQKAVIELAEDWKSSGRGQEQQVVIPQDKPATNDERLEG